MAEMACTINLLFVQKRIDVVLIAPLSNDLSNLRIVAIPLFYKRSKDQLMVDQLTIKRVNDRFMYLQQKNDWRIRYINFEEIGQRGIWCYFWWRNIGTFVPKYSKSSGKCLSCSNLEMERGEGERRGRDTVAYKEHLVLGKDRFALD